MPIKPTSSKEAHIILELGHVITIRFLLLNEVAGRVAPTLHVEQTQEFLRDSQQLSLLTGNPKPDYPQDKIHSLFHNFKLSTIYTVMNLANMAGLFDKLATHYDYYRSFHDAQLCLDACSTSAILPTEIDVPDYPNTDSFFNKDTDTFDIAKFYEEAYRVLNIRLSVFF